MTIRKAPAVDELLTAREAAVRLKTTDNVLAVYRNRTRAGHPAGPKWLKFGTRVMYRTSDIDAYIQAAHDAAAASVSA